VTPPSSAKTSHHDSPARPSGAHQANDVEAMVERLVAKVTSGSQSKPASSAGDDPTDVILDLEVSGVRCLLVRNPHHDAPVKLSPREQEIARMVARGYPNKTIASVLDISSWTVGTHLRRIFAKLRVSSRAAMVARLIQEGIMQDKAR
jgi:DNA-binding CsgD family transcriptional regulator